MVSWIGSSSKALIAAPTAWRMTRVLLIFLLVVLIVHSLLYLMLIYKLRILERLHRHVPCFFHWNAYGIVCCRLGTKNVSLFVPLFKSGDPVVAIVLHSIFCVTHCGRLARPGKGELALELALMFTVHLHNELMEILFLQICQPISNVNRNSIYSLGKDALGSSVVKKSCLRALVAEILFFGSICSSLSIKSANDSVILYNWMSLNEKSLTFLETTKWESLWFFGAYFSSVQVKDIGEVPKLLANFRCWPIHTFHRSTQSISHPCPLERALAVKQAQQRHIPPTTYLLLQCSFLRLTEVLGHGTTKWPHDLCTKPVQLRGNRRGQDQNLPALLFHQRTGEYSHLWYLCVSHASNASIGYLARFESLSMTWDEAWIAYTFELCHCESAFHINQALKIMLEVFEDQVETTPHLVFTTRWTNLLLANFY